MKAMHFLGEKKIELIDMPQPQIRDDEVLLEMKASGLCGSDLHLFYTPSRAEKEAGIFGLKFDPDLIPGHEPCGQVVQVGASVKHLKIGDRVAVAHISGCGNCSIVAKVGICIAPIKRFMAATSKVHLPSSCQHARKIA